MQNPTRILLLALSVSTLCAHLQANQISQSQEKWLPKYAKEKNAPKPENMLLNTDPEPDLKGEFRSLYNGEDLSGWTARGGNCIFEAIENTIVATCVPGSPSTYLTTDKNDYRDFLFTCEVMWEVDGNTGIQIRSKVRQGDKGEVVYGPQIELEDAAKQRGWSGAIYGQSCGGYWYPLWLDAHEEVRNAINYSDWNRVTIEAKGHTMKTWINGVPAANHVFADDEFLQGFIALQSHSGKQGKIHFRNLWVRELSPAE